MNFDAAFITEQGVEIGIFATTMDVLSNEKEADNLIRYCKERIFVGFQVVLMAQDRPRYTTLLWKTRFNKTSRVHYLQQNSL